MIAVSRLVMGIGAATQAKVSAGDTNTIVIIVITTTAIVIIISIIINISTVHPGVVRWVAITRLVLPRLGRSIAVAGRHAWFGPDQAAQPGKGAREAAPNLHVQALRGLLGLQIQIDWR